MFGVPKYGAFTHIQKEQQNNAIVSACVCVCMSVRFANIDIIIAQSSAHTIGSGAYASRMGFYFERNVHKRKVHGYAHTCMKMSSRQNYHYSHRTRARVDGNDVSRRRHVRVRFYCVLFGHA